VRWDEKWLEMPFPQDTVSYFRCAPTITERAFSAGIRQTTEEEFNIDKLFKTSLFATHSVRKKCVNDGWTKICRCYEMIEHLGNGGNPFLFFASIGIGAAVVAAAAAARTT